MISIIRCKVLQSLKTYLQRVHSHLKFSNSDKQCCWKSAGNYCQPRPKGALKIWVMLLKQDWIHIWDIHTLVHTHYCHFTALTFYFSCTLQGPSTRVGDEFVVHCFGVHASHLGKIYARINKQFNSACKFHSWTLQDPYVQILLIKTDCDANYVCYFSQNIVIIVN